MNFDCTTRNDIAFQAAAVRGPRQPPHVSVQGLLPPPAGFAFVLTLTYEQALAMREALEGAIDLIEAEVAEAERSMHH
ncbi:hypothetical protein [Metallibacterium scheffleri]|uniref:Uncharacterized protein n=1 Tax=Metallibacterium scheffleri TaxID=993689 RepID=A0A4S3KQN5_9GAMM|nr:hypothetical protein [Metallibacterium scheffleri]THD11342.1 hypothetical protein B1806_04275 [Metallibacterium scheffleri]